MGCSAQHCSCKGGWPIDAATAEAPAPGLAAYWSDSHTRGGCSFCNRFVDASDGRLHPVLCLQPAGSGGLHVRLCHLCLAELKTALATTAPTPKG